MFMYKYILLSTSYCFIRKFHMMNKLEDIKVLNENNTIRSVPITFTDKFETSLMSMCIAPILFPINVYSDIENMYYNKETEYQKVRLIADYIFK